MKKRLLIMLIIYLLLVLAAAIIPITNTPEGFDKIFHFIEFFILTLLLKTVLMYYEVKDVMIIAPLGALLFALVTEAVQIPVASRDFDVFDLVADIAGILAGMLIKFKRAPN